MGVGVVSGLAVITSWVLVLGQLVGSERPRSRPADGLVELVEQLGADRFELRQQAMERLWSAGELAIPALELGSLSKNAEIRTRASYVLENLRQGLTIDTPREIRREVQRFRDGDVDARRQALRNLETAHRPRIVLGLVRAERDTRLRDEWFRTFEYSLRMAILAGEEREAELALREAATDDEWMRHWAAFVADSNLGEKELARLVAAPSPANPAEHALRIAYLLRAQGELSEAQRYAEQAEGLRASARSPDRSASRLAPSAAGERARDLAWQLTLERRDWPAAARAWKSRPDADPSLAKDPEFLGFAVAYFRLAGELDESRQFAQLLEELGQEAARAMSELAPNQQDARQMLLNQQWLAGKALLLNGQLDDAVSLLRQHHASFTFEVLVQQQRYREAFDVAGIAYPHGLNQEWFESAVAETTAADDAARQRFHVAMHAARHASFLGQRGQVRESLASMLKVLATDSGTARRRMLCETAVKLGFRDLAREAGAMVLEREGSPSVLSILYPNRHRHATMWFEYFREQRMQESLAQSLTRIDRCLRYGGDLFPDTEFTNLIADVEAKLPQLAEPKRSEWLHGLAETCLLHGQRERGWSLLAQAAQSSSADALRLGDLYAGEHQWREASDWYRRAWEFDKLKPLPAYLHAQAMIQAGQVQEGERLARRALRACLGSGEVRRELAIGLKERGYRQESFRQFELLVRTGEPGEQDVIEAAKQIGNAVYQQDELLAADCWETMILSCLRSKWGFVESHGYVQIPFLVHKTRATGLVRAGRVEEGLAEARLAARVSPFNLELPEELVPALQEAGRLGDADTLFYDYYAALDRYCRDFPDCATWHNNFAWLVARNGRELEAALRHAERALQLDPENPSYLDTLGEVHFRLGQLAQAIDCAERCARIEPSSSHNQAQLARYQAARDGG